MAKWRNQYNSENDSNKRATVSRESPKICSKSLIDFDICSFTSFSGEMDNLYGTIFCLLFSRASISVCIHCHGNLNDAISINVSITLTADDANEAKFFFYLFFPMPTFCTHTHTYMQRRIMHATNDDNDGRIT